MDSRCLRDLDHLGNRNRRPRAARSGRLYISFRGDLNPVDTSNPSSNLYLVTTYNTVLQAALYYTCKQQATVLPRSDAMYNVIRCANTFGQACKHLPCIAFVHVNAFVNAFALACECVCKRVWLGMRMRSKHMCIICCMVGSIVCALLILATICSFITKREDFRLSLGPEWGEISPAKSPFPPSPTKEEMQEIKCRKEASTVQNNKSGQEVGVYSYPTSVTPTIIVGQDKMKEEHQKRGWRNYCDTFVDEFLPIAHQQLT